MNLKTENTKGVTFEELFNSLNNTDKDWINAYLSAAKIPKTTFIQQNNDNVLLIASLHNKVELVAELLKNGANPHRKNPSGSLLAIVAEKGLTKIAQLLIDAGVDRLTADNDNPWMPSAALCRAAANGHTETVKLLLQHRPYQENIDAQAVRMAKQFGHDHLLLLFPATFPTSNKGELLSNENKKEKPVIISLNNIPKKAFIRYLYDYAANTPKGKEEHKKGIQLTAKVPGLYTQLFDSDIDGVLTLAQQNQGCVNDVGYLQLGIQFMGNTHVNIASYLKIYTCSQADIEQLLISKQLPSQNINFLPPAETTKHKLFQPALQTQAKNSIEKLNMTVDEFNQNYLGQYSIKEDTGYSSPGFWSVRDENGKECGVLSCNNRDNQLKETQFSGNKYNFINTFVSRLSASNCK